MNRRRSFAALRAASAAVTVLLALSALAAAYWAVGWLLGAAGKAVGLR